MGDHMFNRPNRNDVDDGVQDIQNDVNQLADSLESVLKSWGSDAKGEAEAARSKAQGDAFPEMEASADIFFIKRRNDL